MACIVRLIVIVAANRQGLLRRCWVGFRQCIVLEFSVVHYGKFAKPGCV